MLQENNNKVYVSLVYFTIYSTFLGLMIVVWERVKEHLKRFSLRHFMQGCVQRHSIIFHCIKKVYGIGSC